MYTNCPECGTVFRISTNDLRVAEGYVRCGHCSATFNALGSLTDEPPPTVTLRQLTLATEPDPGTALPPEISSAGDDEPLLVSEDSLEFNIPEGNWSNFFDSEAAGKSDAVPAVSPRPENEEAVEEERPASQPDVGDGIGSATVDQAGLFRALTAEAPDSGQSSGLDDDADWRELLAEVPDDDAAPEPVYVISDEPRTELHRESPDEPALPEPAWETPAPLPADFAADLPLTARESELRPAPWPPPDDPPFIWRPPSAAAPVRSGHRWAYRAGSVLLALTLVIQVLHFNRDELATKPLLNAAIQRTYTALGLPLWPAWDLRSYELRNSEAVADRSSRGALDILARIVIVGNDYVGLPVVRVTLRDRFGRSLGSRVFQPAEYLAGKPEPREPVPPGTMIPVEISLKDPGPDAQGFDVEPCVLRRREGLLCRADREPFAR